MAGTLQKELTRQVERYTGSDKSKASVEAKSTRLECRIWLDMGEGSSQAEAAELAQIILGPRAGIGPHKLVPNMWVAGVWLIGGNRDLG